MKKRGWDRSLCLSLKSRQSPDLKSEDWRRLNVFRKAEPLI